MQVDAHYGTLQDYRELSDALHRAGMYLVQDVVVNHVGNFFSYDGEFDPARPRRGFRLNSSAEAACASALNLALARVSVVRWAGRNFNATHRPSDRSRAL
jgi:hypothetical protein